MEEVSQEEERFKDAVAFARAATAGDWDGVAAIMAAHDSYLNVMVPMAWLVKALVDTLANEREIGVDEVWMRVLDSIEGTQVEGDNDEDSRD